MTEQRYPQLRVVEPASSELDEHADATARVAAIFRVHSKYVATVALRLIGRDSEVDDLIQEVFLETVRSIGSLRNGSAIRPWLATVTVRVARRQLRKRRLRSWLGIDAGYAYENVESVDLAPDQQMLIARIYRALDALAVNERLAWSLRMIEGERLEDVARLCSCSLAAAKRRIASAHAKIRKAVGHV